jgi:signal transduction histidine kinase
VNARASRASCTTNCSRPWRRSRCKRLLSKLGLVPALERRVAQFEERSGVACRLDAGELAEADESRLAPAASCLYRVTQEALDNVAEHSRARPACPPARPLRSLAIRA